MSVVKLVRLGPPAAKACAAIEAELFAGDDPWPESAFMAELAAPNNFYVGLIADVDEDEELCGYAGITKLGPAGAAEYEIHTIGAVSYTHLTLPTIAAECRSRWSPYH